MKNKTLSAVIASALLAMSISAFSADSVSIVFNCTLKEGKTQEDAMAVNAEWLKWARELAGTDAITSSYVVPVVGDLGGHMWVDSYPNLETWGKVFDAELPEEIEAAFNEVETCSGTRLYAGTETKPAK